MSTRFKPGNRIGERTRFQPGNAGGPGRPRTAKLGKLLESLGSQYHRHEGGQYCTHWELFARDCLRQAANGSIEHAKLLAFLAGQELVKETQDVLLNVVENPDRYWILKRRPPHQRVPGPRVSAQKRADEAIKRQFSAVQGAPQESAFSTTYEGASGPEMLSFVKVGGHSPHELARQLVGVPEDRPGQASQAARPKVRVELW
jgi:hypothetical protein